MRETEGDRRRERQRQGERARRRKRQTKQNRDKRERDRRIETWSEIDEEVKSYLQGLCHGRPDASFCR